MITLLFFYIFFFQIYNINGTNVGLGINNIVFWSYFLKNHFKLCIVLNFVKVNPNYCQCQVIFYICSKPIFSFWMASSFIRIPYTQKTVWKKQRLFAIASIKLVVFLTFVTLKDNTTWYNWLPNFSYLRNYIKKK